ncbi:TPA: hypothetical protein KOR75_001084 [Clostridioides difficile]|nr:hypothetical protein [Clostridioides difficile]
MENIISCITIYIIGVIIITMLNKYVTKVDYKRNNIITIAVWSIFTLFIYISNNHVADLIIILMIIVTFIFLVRDKSDSELNTLLKKIKTILKYIGLTCLIINVIVNILFLSSINKVYDEITHKTNLTEYIEPKYLNVGKIFLSSTKMLIITGAEIIDMTTNIAYKLQSVVNASDNVENKTYSNKLVDMSIYKIDGLPKCVSLNNEIEELFTEIDKVIEDANANKENSVNLKISVDNMMDKIKTSIRILSVFGIIDFLAFVYVAKVIIPKLLSLLFVYIKRRKELCI